MKQVWTVFEFTLKDVVKKKAFIISTVIIVAAILILSLVPKGISLFSGEGEKQEESGAEEAPAETGNDGAEEGTDVCYYVDEANLIPGGMDALSEGYPDIRFEKGKETDIDGYRKKMEEDHSVSVVWLTEQDKRPFIHVVNRDFMSGVSADTIAEILSDAYVSQTLSALGIDQTVIADMSQPLGFEEEMVGDLNVTGYVLGIIFTMLMFFAIYYYGYGVAMSVATEKTTRVMETLVVSAKPSRILIGKCLAMGALGLMQFGGILLFAVICCMLFIPDGFVLFGAPVSLSAITPYTAVFLIAYFILGYALFAMLNAVCGASVSKIEDLNSAMMPVSLMAVASFYLGYFTTITTSANGTLQKVAMYFPFSAPFMVPSRLLNGGIKTWEMLVSLGIMLAAIVVLALISVRIYSASVLHYGKRQSILKLLKKAE